MLIVGGGIVGLAIAFHLAERGTRGVVVVERAEIASGSTSKATGGIRQQFTTEAKIRLSRESVLFYQDFAERVGRPLLFRQIGYLFLLPNATVFDAFARGVALQNQLGVPSEMLDPDELARRHPMLVLDGYAGGAFCPTDGYATPADAAYALASRARELGVQIIEGVDVIGIDRASGRVTGAQTSVGAISTPLVVGAAGPWAAELGRMVDLDLPVTAHPRQVFSLSPCPELPADFPFTVDMASGVYVHREPGATLLGGGDRATPSGGPATLDWSRFEPVATEAMRWLPAIADLEARSGWCGLREMTPDDHPILGPAPDLEGFWLAVGFSGHGFMHAPAVGRAMADWILTGQPVDLDSAAFSLARFAGESLHIDAALF
ncbi:MAG: hypothetical protein QOG89_774 [Thermomicrobiales bacterium]|nr:hypothetical protein [Thermomicrobiales bacterium]